MKLGCTVSSEPVVLYSHALWSLVCRECIAEHEQATQLGHRVHRVAHRLFRIGTVCRAELDLWVLSEQPLRCFRAAYRLLLEYALCPLTERCIEAVHALIQRVGRVAINSNPPYVVTKVRETQSLDQLGADTSFHKHVAEQWRPPFFFIYLGTSCNR